MEVGDLVDVEEVAGEEEDMEEHAGKEQEQWESSNEEEAKDLNGHHNDADKRDHPMVGAHNRKDVRLGPTHRHCKPGHPEPTHIGLLQHSL